MEDEIYHRAILSLARDAAHEGRLDSPAGVATVNNPLCGDRVTVEVALDGERVGAFAHRVRGCLLCRAAAAAVGAALIDRDAAALETGRRAAHAVLAGDAGAAAPWAALAHFRPVSAHRSRHECVLLPFEAAAAALSEAARAR